VARSPAVTTIVRPRERRKQVVWLLVSDSSSQRRPQYPRRDSFGHRTAAGWRPVIDTRSTCRARGCGPAPPGRTGSGRRVQRPVRRSPGRPHRERGRRRRGWLLAHASESGVRLPVVADQAGSKRTGDSRNRGKEGQPVWPITTPDRRGHRDAHLWRSAGLRPGRRSGTCSRFRRDLYFIFPPLPTVGATQRLADKSESEYDRKQLRLNPRRGLTSRLQQFGRRVRHLDGVALSSGVRAHETSRRSA
jgi:hypothetical protein